jgi:hypothetical protein
MMIGAVEFDDSLASGLFFIVDTVQYQNTSAARGPVLWRSTDAAGRRLNEFCGREHRDGSVQQLVRLWYITVDTADAAVLDGGGSAAASEQPVDGLATMIVRWIALVAMFVITAIGLVVDLLHGRCCRGGSRGEEGDVFLNGPL